MECPNCHTQVPDTSRFCSDCGTKIGPEVQPSYTRTLETPAVDMTRGTVFAGRYEVIEPLGRGGMGNVYRAFDRKIHEEIAIKFLKPEIAAEHKVLQRFSNELRVARRVAHHNVCRMHDLHEEGNVLYITMEYVRGEDLKTLIRRMGTLTPGKALAIARQVAEGMAEAHKLGVVHRDLKPSNVMIDRDGNAKIMDFGIARSLIGGGMTAEGSMIGTPEYMSPEQVEGKETDSRSDLYSLGILLFEMVTGRVPFDGDTPLSVAFKHKTDVPPNPHKVNPQVPEDLSRLILRCLEKDRDRRFQTAEEFLADLAKIEEGLPTTDRFTPKRKTITPREITFRFTPKKLLVPVAAALVLIAAVTAAWHAFLRPAALPVKERPSVAVISFENQTGDKAFDYLQTAIPNLLITSLEQSQAIRIASWERLRDLLKRLGKGDRTVIDSDLGFEICRMDGIQAIVLGSFVKAGNAFATDVKVLDVGTKRILKTVGSRGDGVDSILKKQIDDLSREIAKGLGRKGPGLLAGPAPITEVTTASLDAYNAFLRGRDEFEKFYYADARRSLERAVELDPAFAMAHSYLWKVYTLTGNADAARGSLEKLKTMGSRAKGKEGLYIQALLANWVERDYDKYLQILKKILAMYPEEKRCRAELGQFYMNTRKYDEAVAELKQALALDPQYGTAINLLAYTYGYQNKFDEAIKQFELYASISPGDANPHDSMGDLFFRMGKFEAAIEKYKEALRVRPDFGSACRISYTYALTENYAQAIKWIDDYIASAYSKGMESTGWQLRAIYHYLFGNVRTALEDLNRAQELLASEKNNDGIDNLYRARIWICYDWGMADLFLKFAKERFDFRAEHKLPTELFNSLLYEFYLGLDDVRGNRLERARARLAEIDKGRAPDKKDPLVFWFNNSYHFLLSEIELKQGRGNEAAEAFKKMGETTIVIGTIGTLLQNNIPLINDIPARGWAAAGDRDKAIAEYERLTSADPMARKQQLIHPFSRLRLARLYEEKGERAKALAQYEALALIWKDADPGLPPVAEARARLAALK